MFDSIISALNMLGPIGLENINSAGFMSRTDIKYVISISRLEELINSLNCKYQVLEICNTRTLPYKTIYLDTPDSLFYNQHVRGELERLKIRFRIYESSGQTFLEIKKKTNKNRTIKIRIENSPSNGVFDQNAIDFIKDNSNINSKDVSPVLINRFNRTTLIGPYHDERITLDFNVSFCNIDNDKHIEMPYLAVIELKKEGHFAASAFSNTIKQMGIRPTGFSKYCIGSSILKSSLRKNSIKPSLLLLNKIENEYNYYINNN
jgi:hypothetical protein